VDKKFFRCTVCNDIHFGAAGPKVCPTCRIHNAYVEVDEKEARYVMEL
jgi:rubrerythrin